MSESQVRPPAPRGRGSGRGGRGGYSASRGGRSKHANGDAAESTPTVSYDDQGEIGQLKKRYMSQLTTVKEMFPDWTEDDIVYALEESNGDMERTIERMTEGNVSQWGEVKKKNKEKLPSKPHNTGADVAEGFARGNRSRGGDVARGGRGRGTERGRGRGRVRDSTSTRVKAPEAGSETVPAATEAQNDLTESQTATEISAQQPSTAASEEFGWDVVNPADAAPPVAEPAKTASKPDGTRTWASMFAPKPSPAPVTPISKAIPKVQPTEAPSTALAPSVSHPAIPSEELPVEEADATLPPSAPEAEPAVEITPSEDQLTESNLQQVPGSPQEPATATVVSNAGTNEIRTASGLMTPVPGSATSQQPIRPGLGGFQTSALKATTPTPRSSSFARRVKEQHEAVVMPGNHAVDRAAVQFGSLGLGSSSADFEMDDDREQPETREQPPQHSPVAPKASLPAVSQQVQPDVGKTTTGLPPAPGPQAANAPDQQQAQTSGQPAYSSYSQLGYGHPGQIGDNATAQKGYEPFGQQASQVGVGSLNGYPSQSQAQTQSSQTTHQSHLGAYSSAANDYSSYYTSDPQRSAYNMYGAYGQGQGLQDTNQKASTNFGTTSASELPATTTTGQTAHPNQTRFGAMDQNSGHSTPNPQSTTQTQAQGQQGQQVGQSHANQQAGYHYGASNPYYGNYYPNYMGQPSYGRSDRPPFDDVRRYEEQYLNQTHHYGYGGNQAAYGAGPYGGAGGKYGQPHQGYGMPSQAWDTHAGSPANTGGYGQQAGTGRENTTGHSTYGRTGSTQPAESQQGATSFGGMTDVFSRSASGYGSQTSHQQSQQAIGEDSSRGYGDSSKATGPSPVPAQNAGRPNSAANAQNQGTQAQNQQQTYGGYPAHGQQSHYGSGYGHQNTTQGHQTSGYGAYAGFGGNYYGNNSRGNWSGSYNH